MYKVMVMKRHYTFSLDHEVIDQIKKQTDNLSLYIETVLKDSIINCKSEDPHSLIKAMHFSVAEFKQKLEEAEALVASKELELTEYCKKLKEFVESCPEALNLTDEQLSDVKFLDSLVATIRQKYDNHMSVRDIQLYYKLRNRGNILNRNKIK